MPTYMCVLYYIYIYKYIYIYVFYIIIIYIYLFYIIILILIIIVYIYIDPPYDNIHRENDGFAKAQGFPALCEALHQRPHLLELRAQTHRARQADQTWVPMMELGYIMCIMYIYIYIWDYDGLCISSVLLLLLLWKEHII